MLEIRKKLALITVVAVGGEAVAQGPDGDSLCDPGLTGSSQSPIAYRLRGDRCEGQYALQVSSTQIRLASMVEAFDYDPADPSILRVVWHLGGSRQHTVRLRAQSLRPKTYYRMDTEVRAEEAVYDWPSDVLAGVGLLGEELGILGWTTSDDGAQKTYLPLTVFQGENPGAEREYQIAVVPEHRLRDVFVTLTKIDAGGEPRTPVFIQRPLEAGYYPAKQATLFTLEKPQTGGDYEVRIECTVMGGGSITTSFRFYHAGAPGGPKRGHAEMDR